jgi:uncharacterized protein (TIGR03067 family)
MQSWLLKTLALGTALALVAADPPAGEATKKDKEKLAGTWKLTSGEYEGKASSADLLAGAELKVTGDKYVFKYGDGTEEGTIKLDATKKPKEITLEITSGEDKGKTQLGIYSLDDDTLKLCTSPAGEKERPKELVTKDGSKQSLFVFKRQKS